MTTYGWALRRIVDPPIEPLTLEEAKQQCQIDADLTEQDAAIQRFIRAARELAESYTRQSFVEQTWRLTAEAWPTQDCQAIVLPNGPILAIESVTYLDSAGARIALESSDYWVSTYDAPARLYPAFNTTWPSARLYPGSIEITYRAGYESAGSPADAQNVPAMVKQAMALLVAHWYANRENAIVGTIVEDAPMGFYTTLDPLRVYP